MEREAFNILFYVRKNKLKKDGQAPVILRLTVNGKRWKSALKVSVDLNQWDSKKERATGDKKD